MTASVQADSAKRPFCSDEQAGGAEVGESMGINDDQAELPHSLSVQYGVSSVGRIESDVSKIHAPDPLPVRVNALRPEAG